MNELLMVDLNIRGFSRKCQQF